MEGVGGKDLRKRYLLSLKWKTVGVMDNDSGDDGSDELEKSEKKLRRVRNRMTRIRLME